MKTAQPIRRTLLVTLMVFATAAIGLQPFVSGSTYECGCQANAASDVDVTDVPAASCCRVPVKVQESSSCCSSKPATQSGGCCCNPEALVCECVNCHCGEANETTAPTSAIPSNETTEVVSPTLICATPLVCCPKQSEITRASFRRTVAEHAALSSQETCVLLSRFTC